MSEASSRTVLVKTTAAAVYSRMNTTGSTVKPEIQRIESRIIRRRRDVQDAVVVSRAAGGNLPSELHFPVDAGSIDGTSSPAPAVRTIDQTGALYTLIRSALQTNDADFSDQTYDATASILGLDLTVTTVADYEVGDVVQLLDIADVIQGYFRVEIVDVPGSKLTLDSRSMSVPDGTIKVRRGLRLINGSKQLEHDVIIEDNLTAPAFERFVGMHTNTMQIRIADGEITTIDFGMVGEDSDGITASVTPPTSDADKKAPVVQVYNSKGHVPVLFITTAGVAGVLELKEWSVDLQNGMEPRTVIGQLPATSIRSGTLRVQGQMKAYLDDVTKDLYNAAVQDQEASALYVAENDEELAMSISLPRLKFTSEAKDNTGQDTDIFVDLGYTTLAALDEDDSIRIQFFDKRL